ncbi:hypothetical protein BH10BDE1_BH10BDE1_28120 [soil metagenome]
MISNSLVRNIGSWAVAKALSMTQPSIQDAEKALANVVARKHDEDMRQRALELSLGYRPMPGKGDRI